MPDSTQLLEINYVQVLVTDPVNPVMLGHLIRPAQNGELRLWGDAKVYSNHVCEDRPPPPPPRACLLFLSSAFSFPGI